MQRLQYPLGATWRTVILGKTAYVPDTGSHESIGPVGIKLGIKSYVSIPLNHEDKVVGVVNIYTDVNSAFRNDIPIFIVSKRQNYIVSELYSDRSIRHRHGHTARAYGHYPRPVFHDEGVRQGLGPRALYRLRDHQGPLGFINVESHLGKDTTFTVYLPVTQSTGATHTLGELISNARAGGTARLYS